MGCGISKGSDFSGGGERGRIVVASFFCPGGWWEPSGKEGGLSSLFLFFTPRYGGNVLVYIFRLPCGHVREDHLSDGILDAFAVFRFYSLVETVTSSVDFIHGLMG